jgi:hypothetical protein
MSPADSEYGQQQCRDLPTLTVGLPTHAVGQQLTFSNGGFRVSNSRGVTKDPQVPVTLQ